MDLDNVSDSQTGDHTRIQTKSPYLEVISKVGRRFEQATATPNGTDPRAARDGRIVLVAVR
jgi:hypothetical protein